VCKVCAICVQVVCKWLVECKLCSSGVQVVSGVQVMY